jgi:NADH-quinone oxidoreductase subunit C
MSGAVIAALSKKFGDAILETADHCGDETAVVDGARLVAIAEWLKTDEAMAFDSVAFVTCIDRLDQPRFDPEAPRFEVVYQLRSSRHRHRVRLKVKLAETKPEVPTLSHLWPAFNWLERECYDMYGVQFSGHPDLRRIYMYEEFVGYPLRKDYPKEKRQPLVRREWTDEVTDFAEDNGGAGQGS